MSNLAGVGSVLFAHAHPDDETLSTGALITHLTRLGVPCDVVTATRGEEGDVVPGPLEALAGTPELTHHREGELAAALRTLGVRRHVFLGTAPARDGAGMRQYRDSGMTWIRPGLAGPRDADDERSFVAARPEEAVADLAALLRAWRPDLLISYDASGGYGHPDHVRMHEVARASAALSGVHFAEVRHEQGADVEWLDLPETRPTVASALRCHASQLTVQPGDADVIHSGGQREAIATSVGLRFG